MLTTKKLNTKNMNREKGGFFFEKSMQGRKKSLKKFSEQAHLLDIMSTTYSIVKDSNADLTVEN